MKVEAKKIYSEVYEVVKQIPKGKVMTYGQIARLLGCPQHSRLVGQALMNVPESLQLPCHRVVNSEGRLVPHWLEQRHLLLEEGITFKTNGCVDLKKQLWELI